MPYKNLNDIPLFTQIIVFLSGLWGAIMNFLHRLEVMNENISLRRKIFFFVLDLLSSSGISVIVFLGAVGYGLNETIAVALSGIMAHQGTRAFFLIELFIAEKLKSKELEKEIKKHLKT